MTNLTKRKYPFRLSALRQDSLPFPKNIHGKRLKEDFKAQKCLHDFEII